MESNNDLRSLERLCATVYSGSNQVSLLDKLEAQRTLLRLQSSSQYMGQLKTALEQSTSPETLLFACKGLEMMMVNDWRNITPQARVELQKFLLQSLVKYSDPSNFVTKAVIHVLCKVTKLGWCSEPQLRSLLEEVVNFIRAGGHYAVLGLRILSELISEFELGRTESSGRMDPEGRLVAQAFREQDGLTNAFLIALDAVRMAFDANDTSKDKAVLKEALNTLHTCLSYDFVGTGYSESDDVVSCLYIPVEWAKHIATAQALRLLFQIYIAQWKAPNESQIDASDDGPASLSLQCIALVSSTRRSVFDENSRQEFLVALLDGTTRLMQEKIGLSHSEPCLHHLCRVLSRVKGHFQLLELTKPPQYQQWLQSLASFTEEALHAWRAVSPRTIHYLIRLWGALVLPTPYLRMRESIPRSGGGDGSETDQPNYLRGLDSFVPRIVQAFVSTRAAICSASALEELNESQAAINAVLGSGNNGYGNFGEGNGGIEDNPLDDEGMLLEQLTPLSMLARYRYSISATGIGELYIKAMSDRAQAINMLIQQQSVEAKMHLVDAQARLAFLTYLVGAIIGGHVTRVSARAIDRLEELNSELAALVFKMVNESQQMEEAIQNRGESPAVLIFGFGSNAGWRLELATLYFFRCFQTLYIESRAREDEYEKQGRQRAIELVEDPTGFMSFSFIRRGAIAAPSNSIVHSSDASGNGSSSSSSSSNALMVPGPSILPMFHMRNLPSASPSLDILNRGLLSVMRSKGAAGQMEDTSSDNNDSKQSMESSTPYPSPILVDELSAAELAKKEKEMNDEASARAAAMQQSIAHRVGVQGGDRALLDIAMRRIFGLLQYAQHANERNVPMDESSAPVMLVQRALSVLYQLSVGVTIVHAGRVSKPRLVSSGRLLLESEVIQDLLLNPSAERFPLLREPQHGRARTFLMATLSKLLFTQIRFPSSQNSSEVPENMFDVNAGVMTAQEKVDERFIAFMKPMTDVSEGLINMAKNNVMDLRRPDLKKPIIGLFRDLRGVISSATSAREYELIFAWFFPNRIRLLSAVASVWNDNFEVMVPLLKLLSELVHNRGARIMFPELSPGGIILFRESSKVLVSYCSPQLQSLERMKESQRSSYEQREIFKEKLANLNNDVTQTLRQALGGSEGSDSMNSSNPGNDPMSMQALKEAVLAMGEEFFSTKKDSSKEKEKLAGSTVVRLGPTASGPGITVDQESLQLKCSRVCLLSLSRMLSGRYAPLGTFQLFGDTCLLDARQTVLELALSGSPKHVMSFPKMAKALVQLLGLLADQFVLSLVDLSAPLFGRIMACLGEAVASNNTALSSPAVRTIEIIATFRCKAAAAVHNLNEGGNAEMDTLQRIRAVLNPEHRSRGDTTSLEDYRKAAQLFAMHEQAHPELFGSLLSHFMDTLLSMQAIDNPSLWPLAKVVMPLVLCSQQTFQLKRAEFLGAQSVAKEPRLRESFDQLFSKLAPAVNNPSLFNAVLRSNETFSKQLCAFCRDLRRE